MISVEEHRARILSAVAVLEPVTIPIEAAQGRTLREPVYAAIDLPPFDNSAMDGFAVRFADVAAASQDAPVALAVVGDVPAGSATDPSFSAGEAVRIMTGAPMPSDADTIVPFESTRAGLADSLTQTQVVTAPKHSGMHVRRRGDDCSAGTEVLPAGALLGPRQLAAAAAVGVPEVVVSRLPRVAVISTGDELRPAGTTLSRGQIPESNGQLLAGLVTATGAEVALRTSVTDDGDGLRAALADASALGADVVVTSGGVSAGAYEVVRNVADMTFVQVAMQPGKPQGFGAGCPLLFGLPGNPVSVAVSFEMFVRPALLAMQARTDVLRPTRTMTALAGWRTPPGRRQYLPVVVRPDGVIPASAGGSHLAASLGRADGYAVVDAEVDAVTAGDTVDVMLVS